MIAWMRRTVSVGAFALSAALLTASTGCQSSSGGCSSCGSHSAATPVATSPYPGVPGGNVAVGPPAMPAQTPDVTTLPYATQSTLPYGGQKTCPVSGERLGSMGPAIPVKAKGETIFVCCKGCVADVQRDPDTYFAKVAAERGVR